MAFDMIQRAMNTGLSAIVLPPALNPTTDPTATPTTATSSGPFEVFGTIAARVLGLSPTPEQARAFGVAGLGLFLVNTIDRALEERAQREKRDAEVKKEQEELTRQAQVKAEAENKKKVDEALAKAADERQRREYYQTLLARTETENASLSLTNQRWRRLALLHLPNLYPYSQGPIGV